MAIKMGKQFDMEKLKGSENFHTWCFVMKNLLEYKGYEKCITTPVEEESEEKKRLVKQC